MRKWSVISLALAACLWAQSGSPEKVDLGVLHRIKTEAFANRSKVMDTAFYLTDVYGPRLTGSPAAKQAGDWAVKTRLFGRFVPDQGPIVIYLPSIQF